MFKDLSNFGMERTMLQAFGFALAYLVLGVVVAAIAGGVAGAIYGGGNADLAYEVGAKGGLAASVVYSLFIAGMICLKKSLGFGWYFMPLIGAFAAMFGGVLLGLIPAIALTRLANNNEAAEENYN